MAINLRYRLKGSTLVEALAAMLIIVVSISAGFTIYDQVLRSQMNEKRALAKSIASQYMAKASKSLVIGNNQTLLGSFNIKEATNEYSKNIYRYQIIIQDAQSNLMYKETRLIYLHDNAF